MREIHKMSKYDTEPRLATRRELGLLQNVMADKHGKKVEGKVISPQLATWSKSQLKKSLHPNG